MSEIPVLDSIGSLQASADVWFVDIWGVIHDGVRPFEAAITACTLFRRAGGTVVLVSNSPRPRAGVVAQLDAIGVHRGAYDDAITSGDVSRRLIAALPTQHIHHIGPARDVAIFDGLGSVLVGIEAADAIVCTGLVDDEMETADAYRAVLREACGRTIPMICANPDLTVERGGRIIPCAGSIAALYSELGGRVSYAGKPHAPIYDAAMQLAARLRGATVERSRVLAIGDGALTDIAGAAHYLIRAVFVASGVHVRRNETVSDAARRLFPATQMQPIAVMTHLA